MLNVPEFWKFIGELLWPAVVLVVFFATRDKLYGLLGRQNLSIKVAGFELSVADATQKIGVDVSDLQKRLSDLEIRVDSSVATPEGAAPADVPDEPAPTETRATVILWVDDVPSNNAFLIEQCRNNGIDVETALTTKQAMSMFSSLNPGLVITDLGRREDGVNNNYAGLDLIRAVRQTGSTVPIVVYAGQRGLLNRDKLLQAGAQAVTQSAVELQGWIG